MAKIWIDGKLVPVEEATVSVYDHGLLYGDGCFEGIRAYQGRIFKMKSHLERLFTSAQRLRLRCPYDAGALISAMRDTISSNNLKDAYIRLVVTRGVGTLGLNPFACPTPTCLIIADRIQLYPAELYAKGMKVIIARRPRNLIAALDPSIKSLNYLNNILAKIEAIDAGVFEAVMLNAEGNVAECTGDNLFIVDDRGRLKTPPVTAGILQGITRRYILSELCGDLKIPCAEEDFRVDELLRAREVFLTGTAAEIIGVTHVGEHLIGSGEVGPVTKRLTEEFRRRVTSPNAPED